ncbi:MAG: tyrosine--tRNA ligase, partial [Candidatus Micrarchaeota archaeon]
KFLLADSFAWINGKMDGDLDNVHAVGEYFIEVWKAAGVPTSKVEFVWHKQLFDDGEYWKKVILIAKEHSEARTKRALTIAGRKEDDVKQVAQLFYPSMQAADVFQLGVDICQLGIDQRKANMLARDVAEKLGWKKPVSASHKMLLGLNGMQSASAADEETKQDAEIDAKMSKSKPETCIFVHDSREEIARKLAKAYCPAKIVEGNPVLEYFEEIVFRAKSEVTVARPAKFGGDESFANYRELEAAFVAGKLHPLDLKNAATQEIDALVMPIRKHFETNARARNLLEKVSAIQVTR